MVPSLRPMRKRLEIRMTSFREQLLAACKAKASPLGRKLTAAEVFEVAVGVGGVRKPVAKVEMNDDEWIRSLEIEPSLKGVNIRREIAACVFWAKNNKKLPTRRRILNWLAKAERVVDLKASGAQYATGLKVPPAPGPEGWLSWVADNIPPEEDAAWGQVTAAYNCQTFSMLPQSWQARCRGAIANDQ